MPDATMMFHLIMIIAVISAFGGLWFGLSNRRSDVPVEVKYTLAEVGGLVLCLSLLLGFLGVGLSIGPARGE